MTEEDFIDDVVRVCRDIPNTLAVAMGGSRARGDHRADSDFDFALYYRGSLDPSPLEHRGWPGRVFAPGEWGQVMYGGATFDLDGRHFDIHYRNLDVVDHWCREAEQGRFEVHILGFHLAGIPTYMLMGELATGRVLWGDLPRPCFPMALRKTAPTEWLDRAGAEVAYSHYWVATENPINCAGCLARAVVQCGHARLAHRGEWALNEKRILQSAELTHLFPVFANIGSTGQELGGAAAEVEALVARIRAEVGD